VDADANPDFVPSRFLPLIFTFHSGSLAVRCNKFRKEKAIVFTHNRPVKLSYLRLKIINETSLCTLLINMCHID